MDLRVTKGVRIPVPSFKCVSASFRGKKFSGRVGIKIFNLTNHYNPRDVQNNIDSPYFGQFYNSVRRSSRAKFEFVKYCDQNKQAIKIRLARGASTSYNGTAPRSALLQKISTKL